MQTWIRDVFRRKSMSRSSIVCAAIILVSGRVYADNWADLVRSGRESFTAGEYAKAKKTFGDALAAAKQFEESDPRRPETQIHLANTLLELGEFGRCEQLCLETIADVEKHHGAKRPEIASTESVLARL